MIFQFFFFWFQVSFDSVLSQCYVYKPKVMNRIYNFVAV